MRLGIFGGSFDPVHYGHLLLAEVCREQKQLDQVWFIPAAIPPHKQLRTLSPPRQRVEMLELAVADHAPFQVSTLEIDRGGISFTVDTLRAIQAAQPDVALFLLLGGDSLPELPTWRSPGEICQLATPLVVRRAGSPPPDFSILSGVVGDDRLREIIAQQVETPAVEISSSDLRRRIAAGQSIRFRTPRAVERYIAAHGLYRQGNP